jgi:hypothetical protein
MDGKVLINGHSREEKEKSEVYLIAVREVYDVFHSVP